ncbi:methyltransferase domain-containing protein [Streptomyces sp. NPDC056264]|uniref:methyltransferase domain-containing protein n=1 Tax=Streptomyces sp. NPDC056264 TaxID=3345767 RepID=UPI003AAE491D
MTVVVMGRHSSAGVPADVGKVLAEAGLAVRHVTADGGGRPADLSDVEGLLILSVPPSSPAAAAEHALLREALAADVPVLALGTGTRLLTGTATASGVDPSLTSTSPFTAACVSADRGCPVALTPASEADPLLAGIGSPPPDRRPAGDALPLPSDAVVLATCAGHPEQAFRLGSGAWGVRFLADAGVALGPWGERLLRRWAALVAARAEHTATRAFFTRRADDWEGRFAYQAPAYESAVARMRLRAGGLALDLGCGTGRAMPALRAQVGQAGRVLGIDVTPAMLASAARHGRTRHGRLLAADCNRLPLPRRSVDGIFSAGLLDHLPHPRTTLLEWARVSTPYAVLLLFHPSGRAERAARHHRPLDPDDLLAEHNLRPALESTGWHLAEYEDAAGHFLARAERRD